MHFHFFIVNKIGLLIYDRYYQGTAKLSSNDMIRFSSTLNSVHLISAQITPPNLRKSGLKVLCTKTFKLHCYQTNTGVMFCLVSDPTSQDMEQLCKKAYQHYSDFVLKNPFYETDQQIRIEGFDQAIDRLILG